MKLKNVAALAAVMALAFGPAPALAQKGQAGGGASEIILRVCNNTNDNARVAISYQPVGQTTFYNEGWFGVPSRSCQDLRTTDNAFSYGYAEVENDSSRFWAGNFPLCVQYPGPYAFWTYGTACAAGQEVRQFATLQAESFGVYTWNLDPPN
jgi:uncharacterized membrane protein